MLPTKSLETPKDDKNKPCSCGSKKKAKNCCMKELKNQEIYKFGQEDSSEMVSTCIIKLKERFINHRIIDITDLLNNNTYRPYQVANYYDNTIMVAEKKPCNEEVFKTRVDSELSNIMVMYHGSYRTFRFDYLDRVFESVCDMIK